MADLGLTDIVGGGGYGTPEQADKNYSFVLFEDKKNLLVLQDENKTENSYNANC